MRIRQRSSTVAVALDAVCLVVFVVAGRQSHGLDSGIGWFFVVLWPVVVGWSATALGVGLYARRSRAGMRLATTVVIGVGVGLIIRIAVTHRDTPIAFVLVAYAFIALTTVGWRVVADVAPRLLARRQGRRVSGREGDVLVDRSHHG